MGNNVPTCTGLYNPEFGDARSRAIELELQKDRKEQGAEVKLLLLGAGESGKSTIAKQMRIIHCKGFNDEERLRYKEIVYSNIIMSMKALVQILNKTGKLNEFSPECQKYSQLFNNTYSSLAEIELSDEMSKGIKLLWASDVAKQVCIETKDSGINDSAPFFFDDIERIGQANYIPSEQDVLRARARTTGISEVTFSIFENRFRLVDVGGQRSERRKWIHCFQDVTALLFCVALSEYDLTLFEDDTVNRMHESMNLFEEVCNCEWFGSCAIILFLNKSDLFQEKIKRVDLNVCFPEYTGGLDYKVGAAFIKEKFLGLNRDKGKNVYSHITCATDTQNIRFVFGAVKDVLLKATLGKFGF